MGKTQSHLPDQPPPQPGEESERQWRDLSHDERVRWLRRRAKVWEGIAEEDLRIAAAKLGNDPWRAMTEYFLAVSAMVNAILYRHGHVLEYEKVDYYDGTFGIDVTVKGRIRRGSRSERKHEPRRPRSTFRHTEVGELPNVSCRSTLFEGKRGHDFEPILRDPSADDEARFRAEDEHRANVEQYIREYGESIDPFASLGPDERNEAGLRRLAKRWAAGRARFDMEMSEIQPGRRFGSLVKKFGPAMGDWPTRRKRTSRK